MTTMKLIVLALIAGLVLGACGKAAPPAASSGAPSGGIVADAQLAAKESKGNSDDHRPGERDPCTVLDAADVEAVIGKLAGPPFRTNGPNSLDADPKGSACRYETANFRSLGVDVAWSGGGTLQSMAAPAENLVAKLGMKGKLPKGAVPEGVEIAGDWDEAKLMGCCQFTAYFADAMISVEFSQSRATVEQVVPLVNKIIAHIEKPTSVDGRAGLASARQRAAQRPKPRPVCELISRAEVEAIVGPLDAAPTGDTSSCTYSVRGDASSGGTPDRFTASMQWNWGYSDFRSSVAMHGAVSASLLGPVNGVSIPGIPADAMQKIEKMAASMGGNIDKLKAVTNDINHPTQTDLAGPWDDAAYLAPEFLAVKKDVRLKVEGIDSSKAKLVAAKIMEKI